MNDQETITNASGAGQATSEAPLPPARGSATQRTIHMCVDIKGVMRWPDKTLASLFTDDGVKRPGRVVRDWLKLQLAQGKRVLPMGEPCEGFSYQTGCPGHPVESLTSAVSHTRR